MLGKVCMHTYFVCIGKFTFILILICAQGLTNKTACVVVVVCFSLSLSLSLSPLSLSLSLSLSLGLLSDDNAIYFLFNPFRTFCNDICFLRGKSVQS